MDVAHVLLDRPWQFDVDATHHCRKNTYSITKDGKSYIMKPLLDSKAKKEPTVIIIGEKEILKTLKESNNEPFF